MSDISGLEMSGLSAEMEAFCRAIHSAFLQQHGITSWPTSVTVIPKEPIPNHPQQCEMHMRCGVQGSNSSSIEAVTTNPEADLRVARTGEDGLPLARPSKYFPEKYQYQG